MKKFFMLLTAVSALSFTAAAKDFAWSPLAPLYTSAGLVDWTLSATIPGQFQLDNHGRVFMRGIITCTVNPVPANVTVFTLPPGYRPSAITAVPVLFDNGGVNGLQFNPDGTVYLRSPFYCNQNVDFLSFEGVNFSTN
jgi:hypothetical protein